MSAHRQKHPSYLDLLGLNSADMQAFQDTSVSYYLDLLHDSMSGIANHAQQLQLSIHGHLVALPGSRSIYVWLCLLAVANIIPSCLKHLRLTGWTVLLLLWLVAEACFAVYQHLRIKKHQHVLPKPSDLPSGLGLWYLQHIKDLDVPLDDMISGWFFGAPVAEIPRHNVKQYFSYIFNMAAYESLEATEQVEVDAVVEHFEERIGCPFRSGYDPTLKFMGHLWEPLQVVHLPLLVYVCLELAGWAADLVLWCMGFTACKDKGTGTKYWLYDPTCAAARAATNGGLSGRLLHVSRAHLSRLHSSLNSLMDLADLQARLEAESPAATPIRTHVRNGSHKHPIMFLHGVMGLLLCLPLIKPLSPASLMQRLSDRCREHPIILLDVRSVSMRLCRQTVDYDDVSRAAASVLHAHGLGPAVFVGHSYGTLVMSRVHRMFPELIAGQVLLEPVSLLPVLPSLLHNFVYKVPSLRSVRSWRHLIILMRALLARELAVADTFCRKFLWYKLITWPMELPRNTIVALAACDDLVPYKAVQANLPRGVVQLHHSYGMHGEVLTNWAFQEQVVTALARMLKRLGHKKVKA